MRKKIDLVGQKFGRLTVLREEKPHVSTSGKNIHMWLCVCECDGKEVILRGDSLRHGRTKSCGCLRIQKCKERKASHGMVGQPEYKVWSNMKSRCYNSNTANYPNYGGRGIKVCERWLESFENFYEDMGERPSKNHSIERLDVNGGYSLENCIWIENEKQTRNQRMKNHNTSGVTGVFFSVNRNCWIANWMCIYTSKNKRKHFSINKYGKDEAFRLACEYREKMVQELNEQGAGYTEQHGI